MNELELRSEFDRATNQWQVVDFESTYELARKWVEENAPVALRIQDDGDRKAVKEKRTLVRKKLDEVSQARKFVNEQALGRFNEQIKSIEKLLKDADAALKENLDAYEEAHGGAKQKKSGIAVRSFDPKAIAKVRALAEKLGCEVKDI